MALAEQGRSLVEDLDALTGNLSKTAKFVDFLTQQFGDTPPWERYRAAQPSIK